jgi:putative PIG3 family NAD(P)H quinone oxidoreductase
MIPERMRFIDHGAGGEPAVMRLADGPVPAPRPGEVLIRVAHAGVNRPDVQQRKGLYPPPAGASPVLGLEVAGRIVAIGEGVTRWAVGQPVCALTPGGGYAEYCTAPEGSCLPVPAGLSLREAAALPETFFTVWSNVFDRGRLAAGERFLVHGGSSGIGITAIQLAKAFGAQVFTTVGSDEKAAACRALGADVVINYRTQDWAAELWTATAKKGVNLILDMVGGDYTNRNLRSLSADGRLVQIGFLQGSKVEIDATPILMKRLTFTGSTLRPRTLDEKAAMAAALREGVWPLLEAGKARPVIHQTFPLADAAAAHALMESSAHIGKIMLDVQA